MNSPNDPQRGNDHSVPWLWLGLGTAISLLIAGGLLLMLVNFLARPPVEASAGVDPTIIRLTAPPLPTATPLLLQPTPTVAPTSTPVPTVDPAFAPPEVTAGYYAVVVDTGGVGVRLRNGPSTRNVPVSLASEGSILFVIEGPEDADSRLWWNVRMSDGTEGWAAADFLAPSAAP